MHKKRVYNIHGCGTGAKHLQQQQEREKKTDIRIIECIQYNVEQNVVANKCIHKIVHDASHSRYICDGMHACIYKSMDERAPDQSHNLQLDRDNKQASKQQKMNSMMKIKS